MMNSEPTPSQRFSLRRLLMPLQRFLSPVDPSRIFEEDILKLLLVQQQADAPLDANDLGERLDRPTPEIENQLEQMLEAGQIERKEDRFWLTREGRDEARRVLRAHRLWERYLADETGYPESEWHRQAELEEHRLTIIDTDALSARLDHPTFDPHGDPIPTGDHEPDTQPIESLKLANPQSMVKIIHIEDEPESVYKEAVAAGLYPGAELEILESGDQGFRVRTAGQERLLSGELAENIQIQMIAALQEVLFPLSSLHTGESAQVVRLAAPLRGPTRRRLLDLGLLPGTQVRAEFGSPAGDPIAYRIRGALIALRSEQADWIMVTTEVAAKNDLPRQEKSVQ